VSGGGAGGGTGEGGGLGGGGEGGGGDGDGGVSGDGGAEGGGEGGGDVMKAATQQCLSVHPLFPFSHVSKFVSVPKRQHAPPGPQNGQAPPEFAHGHQHSRSALCTSGGGEMGGAAGGGSLEARVQQWLFVQPLVP